MIPDIGSVWWTTDDMAFRTCDLLLVSLDEFVTDARRRILLGLIDLNYTSILELERLDRRSSPGDEANARPSNQSGH